MFNVTWIPANTKNVAAGDVNPCNVDIVGSSAFPSLFVAFDDTFVYFRIRLNCDPRMNNKPILVNSIWGVLIKNSSNIPQFTVRVNAKNDPNSNAVQVYTALNTANSSDAFDTLQCTNPIVYGDSGNVEINLADSNFGSDPDFFLDFRTPLSCFPTGFFDSTHIYCGFTSEDANNINKEVPPPYTIPKNFNPDLCGGTPPISPKVRIVKTVTPLAGTTCTTPAQTFTAVITVTNISGQQLQNLTLTDTITGDFTITSGQRTVTFNIGTLNAGASAIFTHIVSGFFNTSGLIPFNTATVNQGETVLGTVTGPSITVLPCRGLQFM